MKLIITQEKKLKGHKYIIGMKTLNADGSLACSMSEEVDVGYVFDDFSGMAEEDTRMSVHENLIRAFDNRGWEIEIQGDIAEGLHKHIEGCKPSAIVPHEDWSAPNQYLTW